jgi:peroxiredoxin
MTSKSTNERERQARAQAAAEADAGRRRTIRNWLIALLVAGLAVTALYAISRASHHPSSGNAAQGSGDHAYSVGSPGPGDQLIDFTLPSTTGGTVSTSEFKGKTVLTYWHEGLGCQPCWDQIRDLEADPQALKDAGVDELVSITSGPLDLIAQKMSDEGLKSVALADTDLAVSKQYAMNLYGMMGDSRDGHSFLLIGPDGKILWRADYGGAPNYTMYVPVKQLLADLAQGRRS